MLSSGNRAYQQLGGCSGVRVRCPWRAFVLFRQAHLQGHVFGDPRESHVFMESHSHGIGKGSAGCV